MKRSRKMAKLAVAGVFAVSTLAVGAVTAPAAQAARCADCPTDGGGGGGGGGGTSDHARYAMYLVSASQLNGSTLRDNDQIVTRTTAGTSGYVKLQLHAAPNVRWWKEIKVFDSSGNAVAQDYVQDNKKDSATLTFTTSSLAGDSLVFSKAKAFGVHTGVYEVHNLQAYGGQSVVFDWERDG